MSSRRFFGIKSRNWKFDSQNVIYEINWCFIYAPLYLKINEYVGVYELSRSTFILIREMCPGKKADRSSFYWIIDWFFASMTRKVEIGSVLMKIYAAFFLDFFAMCPVKNGQFFTIFPWFSVGQRWDVQKLCRFWTIFWFCRGSCVFLGSCDLTIGNYKNFFFFM